MLYYNSRYNIAYAISGGPIVTFSEFVISVRKNLNLSQKQLAAAINVSYSLGKWSRYTK